eukprot:9472288-Pyramimonas_sp.AAC.2
MLAGAVQSAGPLRGPTANGTLNQIRFTLPHMLSGSATGDGEMGYFLSGYKCPRVVIVMTSTIRAS